MILFETQARYYAIEVQPDLFGGVTIVCQWGGKLNRRRGRKVYFAQNLTEADSLIKRISQRRKNHGYHCSNAIV